MLLLATVLFTLKSADASERLHCLQALAVSTDDGTPLIQSQHLALEWLADCNC